MLDEIFEFLGVKVSGFKAHHNICALSFDEMSIVEGRQYDNSTDKIYGNITFPDKSFDTAKATHSLVFMIAGVAGRWKQVVASYFTGKSTDPLVMKRLILDIIQKADAIGLHVISLTSDQAGGNQAVCKAFGFGKVSRVKEFISEITHPIHANKKLYLFSDAPHGFKNVTQSLLNNSTIKLPENFVTKYELPSNLVERDHLEDLFEIQNNAMLMLKLAPKFKESNLYPQGFQKMRVATSSNVLHQDVSGLLNYLSVENENYKTTAKFISHLEKWFALVSSLQISDLLENFQFQFVLMGRFTQDCLENFFSSVRANSPRTTALSFKTALKLISVSHFIKTTKGNYDVDDRNYVSILELVRQDKKKNVSNVSMSKKFKHRIRMTLMMNALNTT